MDDVAPSTFYIAERNTSVLIVDGVKQCIYSHVWLESSIHVLTNMDTEILENVCVEFSAAGDKIFHRNNVNQVKYV